MTLVFDATPLIYLAKAGRLSAVDGLDRTFLIPARVYDEVAVTGVEGGYPDARRIERRVTEGEFEVLEVESETFERLSSNPNLSSADASVLALAEERGGTAVVDDQYARDVAEVEGDQTRGTAYLLLALVREGELPAPEARDALDSMLDAGWYCTPDLYARIVERIEGLGK